MPTGAGAEHVRFVVAFSGVRLRAPATLILALLLASACTGSSKPQTLPTLTATPTSSYSTAPVPSAAAAKTPQGAESFIRFFYEQLNLAFAASNPEAIRAYSNGECEVCARYEAALAASKKSGEYIRGASFDVRDIAVPPLQALGAIAEVTGRTPARAVVDAQGAVLRALKEEGSFHVQVAVKWLDGRWLVSGIRMPNP